METAQKKRALAAGSAAEHDRAIQNSVDVLNSKKMQEEDLEAAKQNLSEANSLINMTAMQVVRHIIS